MADKAQDGRQSAVIQCALSKEGGSVVSGQLSVTTDVLQAEGKNGEGIAPT